MAVPTLKYSHFTSGPKEQREKFAHALPDSFERTGFVKLKGPYLQRTGAERIVHLGPKGLGPMHGYTPWRVEEVRKLHHDVKIRTMMDSKEHSDQGPKYDTDFPSKWPKAELRAKRVHRIEPAFYLKGHESGVT